MIYFLIIPTILTFIFGIWAVISKPEMDDVKEDFRNFK